jgi:hypothetical protein
MTAKLLIYSDDMVEDMRSDLDNKAALVTLHGSDALEHECNVPASRKCASENTDTCHLLAHRSDDLRKVITTTCADT